MRKILTATLAAAVMAAGVAQSATTTTTFAVTATVQSTCSATAAALAFGNYTPGTGTLTGNTTIAVKCTKTTPFTVALNVGSTAGDTFVQRLMGSGVNTLQYNLYTTAALGTVFGDGTGATATVAGVGAGIAPHGDRPDRAAHRGCAASYSHPSKPPRDRLGGFTDRRRGDRHDQLADHLPDVCRALSCLRIQRAVFGPHRGRRRGTVAAGRLSAYARRTAEAQVGPVDVGLRPGRRPATVVRLLALG